MKFIRSTTNILRYEIKNLLYAHNLLGVYLKYLKYKKNVYHVNHNIFVGDFYD